MEYLVFPFAEFWWLYLAFTAGVILLLSLDLGVFHRNAHAVSFREAASWTGVWVALALIFSGVLYYYSASMSSPAAAKQLTLEFLTGYIIEESLSIDNMFVFALVFRQLAIPAEFQHRVLFYGILGALLFRAAFIAAGAALMSLSWIPVVFGLFLVVTGIRMVFAKQEEVDPEHNPLIRLVSRFLPATKRLDGQRFITRVDGAWMMTPLMITLLLLEATDIVFAVDSVPAIFAVTKEPFIVYTSNIFAILGLRSMYFMLAGALDRFHLLKYGLAVVLVFVGLKMSWLDSIFGGHFPIGVSLAIITTVIGGALALSLMFPSRAGYDAAVTRFWERTNSLRSATPAILATGCLSLGALGLAIAMRFGEATSVLPELAEADRHDYYISAVCFAVLGILMLYSRSDRRGH
jgi:tellurite resistance protein TerC